MFHLPGTSPEQIKKDFDEFYGKKPSPGDPRAANQVPQPKGTLQPGQGFKPDPNQAQKDAQKAAIKKSLPSLGPRPGAPTPSQLGSSGLRKAVSSIASKGRNMSRMLSAGANTPSKFYKSLTGMKKGGMVSASKRADGCAIRGKTKGKMV